VRNKNIGIAGGDNWSWLRQDMILIIFGRGRMLWSA